MEEKKIEQLINLSQDEIVMGFVALCIENCAEKEGVPPLYYVPENEQGWTNKKLFDRLLRHLTHREHSIRYQSCSEHLETKGV